MKNESKSTMILAMFLRDSRKKTRLTQRQVAEYLGYSSAQFVSSWERGEREPPMYVIWSLAGLYGLSAETIFQTMLAYRTQALSDALRIEFDAAKPIAHAAVSAKNNR